MLAIIVAKFTMSLFAHMLVLVTNELYCLICGRIYTLHLWLVVLCKSYARYMRTSTQSPYKNITTTDIRVIYTKVEAMYYVTKRRYE